MSDGFGPDLAGNKRSCRKESQREEEKPFGDSLHVALPVAG
jgi:hypothetical protein